MLHYMLIVLVFLFVRLSPGQGFGALKASNIDCTCPDQYVEDFLSKTLHRDVEPAPGTEDLMEVVEPCVPGACKHNPASLSPQTIKFVRSFQKALEENDIRTGSFLVLTAEGFGFSVCFFLGVVLKRPYMQTVLLADIQDDCISFRKDRDGFAQIETTHHLFARCLHATSPDLTTLDLEQWVHRPHLDDNSRLLLTVDEVKTTFSISTANVVAKPRKPPASLPFGLSNRSSRKRKQPLQRGQGSKRQRGSASSKGVAKGSNAIDRETNADDPDKDSSSETSATSDAENNELSDVDNLEGAPDDEAQGATVVPMSKTVERGMADMQEVYKEIDDADQAKESLAQDFHYGKTKGSFFSTTLGLGNGDCAKSGRSRCRNCNTYIKKESVRFEWYWNKLRPPSWVHSTCVMEISQKNELQRETTERLKGIAAASSGSSDNNEPVRAEAVRILSLLS